MSSPETARTEQVNGQRKWQCASCKAWWPLDQLFCWFRNCDWHGR